MEIEWDKKTFGEFLTIQRGHDLPLQKRIPGKIPIIGSFGITGWHNSSKAIAPGLTIGRSGSSIGVAVYTDKDYFPLNTTLYVKDFKGNHPKFAYYFCKNFNFSSFNSGSAIPSLNRNFLYPIEISIPPLKEQIEIANTLGNLDEKIKINKKMQNNLEDITKGLFKSWFVNFEPVKAKLESRSTGLPDEISDLFPESFEESEFGNIPKDWELTSLSNIFSIQGGTQPSAKVFEEKKKEGYIRLLQIRDFYDENHITYVPKSSNLRLVDEDDVLIGRYGSGNGKFMDDSLGRPLRGLSGAINVAVVKTLPKQENMVELIYAMVLSGWFYQKIVGSTSRAVQAGFRKEDIDLISFPLPPETLLNLFQTICSDLWQRCKLLESENNNLSSLRDALLPKLISGELRISDAKKIIEEAGN